MMRPAHVLRRFLLFAHIGNTIIGDVFLVENICGYFVLHIDYINKMYGINFILEIWLTSKEPLSIIKNVSNDFFKEAVALKKGKYRN